VWNASNGVRGGWRITYDDHIPGWNAGDSRTWIPCTSGTVSGSYQSSNYFWVDGSGTERRFPISVNYPADCNGATGPGGNGFADDSSGYLLYVDGTGNFGPIYGPNGFQYGDHFLEDTNGNVLFSFSDRDTLGRRLVIAPPLGCLYNCTPSPGSYQILTSSGSYATYSIVDSSISVSTAFNVPSVTEYSGTVQMISTITLPDGSSYQFGYDSYGELSSMTLPTGGQVIFGYSNFADGYGNVNRWATSQSSGAGSWTYTPQVLSTCPPGSNGCQQTVTVNKPTGDSEVYTFTLDGGRMGNTGPSL
jgi:YD repeat-containing protein